MNTTYNIPSNKENLSYSILLQNRILHFHEELQKLNQEILDSKDIIRKLRDSQMWRKQQSKSKEDSNSKPIQIKTTKQQEEIVEFDGSFIWVDTKQQKYALLEKRLTALLEKKTHQQLALDNCIGALTKMVKEGKTQLKGVDFRVEKIVQDFLLRQIDSSDSD